MHFPSVHNIDCSIMDRCQKAGITDIHLSRRYRYVSEIPALPMYINDDGITDMYHGYRHYRFIHFDPLALAALSFDFV